MCVLYILRPVLFVVLQQLYFRHHGIDTSAFLRLDWIVDEHSENVSLCQYAPGEIWITKPYEKYKQRSETPSERPKLLA